MTGAFPTSRAGLCPGCRHVREVRSERGSIFLRCGLGRTDPRFPKYPPQPVLRCPGHEARSDGEPPHPPPPPLHWR